MLQCRQQGGVASRLNINMYTNTGTKQGMMHDAKAKQWLLSIVPSSMHRQFDVNLCEIKNEVRILLFYAIHRNPVLLDGYFCLN